MDHKIVSYDTSKFPFTKIVSDWFGCELSKIHDNFKTDDDNLKIGNDTKSDAHKTFYKNLDGETGIILINYYYKFIKNILTKEINDECYFQSSPGFRVSSPGSVAVTTWHADGDEINLHPPGEINIFLPLTKCYGNNTIWLETKPGLSDFHPVRLNIGEVLIFDGNKCVHGNYTNDTVDTRVSFDFRLMPKKQYNPNYPHRTATKKLSYTVGEYYSDFPENLK